MNVAELKINGLATVISVDECPNIADGEGSVVTGRFVTCEVDVTARVKILGADGTIEILEGTTVHRIWSLDRDDWVPLGEVVPKENLSADGGRATVISIVKTNNPTPVYNIEVNGEHVYQVGRLGLVVHNTGEFCGDLGAAIARGMDIVTGPDAPDKMVEILQKMGILINRKQIGDVIHKVKDDPLVGLKGADDLVFDRSGGIWNSANGEYLNKIWDWL